LPPTAHAQDRWGRALGRETLDGLLLEQARAAGAVVFQPGVVQAVRGAPGAWDSEVRLLQPAALLRLRSMVLVDAHGSWEDLPSEHGISRRARTAADLFAFKANYAASTWPAGRIGVLCLDGGYGGIVVADQGLATLACCIRRDRLARLRRAAPGSSAPAAVEAWLQHECAGVRQALQGARREGAWLAVGPIAPGVRIDARSGWFSVGNAAAEAHPILGEGISMALQSARLLGLHLLGPLGQASVPDAAEQSVLQAGYVAAWHRQFGPRLRVAAAFAHLAMQPRSARVLMRLAQLWPGLLTQGARWGGKVRLAEPTPDAAGPLRSIGPPEAAALVAP
jgi:flavin-dependent dehydrogenase